MRDPYCNNCERILSANKYLREELELLRGDCLSGDLIRQRDQAVADAKAMAECLGMLDAVGLPEPYDRHVRQALTKERVERYLK